MSLFAAIAISPLSGAAEFAAANPAGGAFAVLPPEQWRRVDESVDRALAWLATQQQADGSFPTYIGGQPAVTSLAVMAFLSRGHHPGSGPYGETINRALDFALKCQRPSGVFVLDRTDMPVREWNRGAHTALYNHAITGLMLGEAYGLADGPRGEKIRQAIDRALAYAREVQLRRSPYPQDAHGWRYFRPLNSSVQSEADLSVTGWFVMFYRSARNAEFDVPEQYVLDAVRFVRACYDRDEGAFMYGPHGNDRSVGRGMTGAGLLCLAVTGNADDAMARSAGDWLLERPYDRYRHRIGNHDRYHYSAYYCSQAMFLLGGDHWRRFYPPLSTTLLNAQTPSGAWPTEYPTDGVFGSAYTTAMSVLALTPPYQLLPIYQR